MFWTTKKPENQEDNLRWSIENDSPEKATAGILSCVYEKIRALVLNNQGQEADFEEIFDDVYVVVWQLLSQKKFHPTGSLLPYVLGIARHKWMDELEKRKKLPMTSSPELPLDRAVSDVFREIFDDEQNRHRNEILASCLEALGEPCRSILTLRFFEEMTWEQVGKTLGKSKDVVESTATRCKKRLRENFEKQWNPNL